MTTTATRGPERDTVISVLNGQIELHIQIAGSGPAVVYFHGAGGLYWSEFVDRLAEEHTVYAPELPGTSAGDPHAIRKVDDYWELLLLYEEALSKLGLERPPAIGQSMGGMIALDLAANFRGLFGKLIGLAPAGLWRDDAPNRLADLYAASPEKVPTSSTSWPSRSTNSITFDRIEKPRWSVPIAIRIASSNGGGKDYGDVGDLNTYILILEAQFVQPGCQFLANLGGTSLIDFQWAANRVAHVGPVATKQLASWGRIGPLGHNRLAVRPRHRVDHIGVPPQRFGQRLGLVVGQIQPHFGNRLRRIAACHSPHHGGYAGRHHNQTAPIAFGLAQFVDRAIQALRQHIAAERLGHGAATRVAGAYQQQHHAGEPPKSLFRNDSATQHLVPIAIDPYDGGGCPNRQGPSSKTNCTRSPNASTTSAAVLASGWPV